MSCPCCVFGLTLDPRIPPEDDMLALCEARVIQKRSQLQGKLRPAGSAHCRQDLVVWRSHHRYLFTRRGEEVGDGSAHRWSPGIFCGILYTVFCILRMTRSSKSNITKRGEQAMRLCLSLGFFKTRKPVLRDLYHNDMFPA